MSVFIFAVIETRMARINADIDGFTCNRVNRLTNK